MFRSLLSKAGVNLKKTTAIINGESSSSSSAKYFQFTEFQNPNVVISKSRVPSSIFYSFSTTSTSSIDFTYPSSVGNDSSKSFVVSYLIKSCGLSQDQAIAASKKLSFNTTTRPDSVLTLLRNYGFTESQISKVISKVPVVLQSNIHEILKPKLDFFKSKGMSEIDLPNFITSFPGVLTRSLNKEIIPNFDTLKSIVHNDEDVVIKMIKRDSWIISTDRVKRVLLNVELLRDEGVPEVDIYLCLVQNPKVYTANRFVEIIEKVKEMGFDPETDTFLKAVHMLTGKSDASFRNKLDVYKRLGGWSEDQILSAFRKHPTFLKASEEKIVAVLNFLVNEMGYDSSIVAENPVVFCCNLEGRVIPRCSVIRILFFKGLIKEMITLDELATMVDKPFLEKFVNNFEQQVPGLMKVFEGQLSYQELLQN